MSERKRDWDVKTGWEKRIKVDFPQASAHPRWSDWTDKERDIVARQHHIRYGIGEEHGFRSKKYEECEKEAALILIGFARDGKPMPLRAHAYFEESGIPDSTKVVWHQPDIAGHGEWRYDPPLGENMGPDRQLTESEVKDKQQQGMWRDQTYVEDVGWCIKHGDDIVGRSPNSMQVGQPVIQPDGGVKFIDPHPDAVASGLADAPEEDKPKRPKIIGLDTEGKMDPKYGGVISYKTMANGDHVDQNGNVISTRESRAKEDVPQWKKFELGRLEILDNVVIPGPNALEKDIKQYGDNLKLTKAHKTRGHKDFIKVGDAEVSTKESDPHLSFIKYAFEVHHGRAHQLKWARVLLATGYQWRFGPHDKLDDIFRDAERDGAMDYQECLEFYERHNRNKRWTQAKEWFEDNADVDKKDVDAAREKDKKREQELHEYHNSPPIQGNYSIADWRKNRGEPVVAEIKGGWGNYIVDPQARIPLWKIDGESTATELWEYKDNKWINLTTSVQVPKLQVTAPTKTYVEKQAKRYGKSKSTGKIWNELAEIVKNSETCK